MPQYIEIIKDDIPMIDGEFILKHYKYGVILEFKTNQFVASNPYLTYDDNEYKQSIDMHRVAGNPYNPLNPGVAFLALI